MQRFLEKFKFWHEWRFKAAILDALCDELPFAMWARDKETGRYVWCSGYYQEIFFAPRDEFIGRTPYKVFPADVAKSYDETDLLNFHGTEVRRAIDTEKPNGEKISLMTVKKPIRIGGEIIGSVGYSYDIKQAEGLAGVK
jgi:hypothetical protein